MNPNIRKRRRQGSGCLQRKETLSRLSSRIGLRSTGLLVFAGRLISAFTGLLFTVMAAHWLLPSAYGTWEVVVTLVTFSAWPVGIVSYWATRDVARGKMVGRTALPLGALLSSVGLLLYFVFTFVTYSRVGDVLLPFLLAALLVPLGYWSAVANAIVQGFRPGVYSYSLLISELAKLAVAYEALYVERLGIEGVILALMASYLTQSLLSTYFVRLTTAEKFNFAQLKRWSRLAWLPLFSYLPTALAVADTFVAAVGFGTTVVGYYQVAFTVASVVGYSLWLAFSLYPLLLQGGGGHLPSISMEFSMLFAIPMAAGCAVLAGPIMSIYGSNYLPGTLGLAILGLMFVFTTASGIVDQALLGTEKVDEEERPKFRSLLRSNLLFVPAANVLYAVVYLASLYAVLSYAETSGFSASATVASWACVQFAATVLFMLVKARRARRYARLLPGRSVLYYILASGVMAAVLYPISLGAAAQGMSSLSAGVRLLGVGALGVVIYFGVVYAVDAKFREMARSLLRRI